MFSIFPPTYFLCLIDSRNMELAVITGNCLLAVASSRQSKKFNGKKQNRKHYKTLSNKKKKKKISKSQVSEIFFFLANLSG